MEFFTKVPLRVRAEELQRNVCITNLPQWCASISRVLESQGDKGAINCVWGEFRIHREVIRDGVRFTVPGCPNALQWTVTADHGGVTVHCTINRSEHAPDFIDSIERFVADWRIGVEAGIARIRERAAQRPTGECIPWYG